MAMNINDIKTAIMNSIRTYIYPYQTISTGTLDLSSLGTINQPFVPFATNISQLELYVSTISGTPGSINVNILNPNGSTLANTLTTLAAGWNTLSFSSTNVVSSSTYNISIVGSGSYTFGCNDYHSYFYGTISSGSILTYKVPITDKVFKIFPGNDISIINSLPLIAIDITARPEAKDAYIHGDVIREILTIKVECYARTPKEVDMLCYGVERGINLNRKSFVYNAFKITPADLGPLSFISPEIFFREVNFHLDMFVTRE